MAKDYDEVSRCHKGSLLNTISTLDSGVQILAVDTRSIVSIHILLSENLFFVPVCCVAEQKWICRSICHKTRYIQHILMQSGHSEGAPIPFSRANISAAFRVVAVSALVAWKLSWLEEATPAN